MVSSEVDALWVAKVLFDQHGAKVAWRILLARAVQEHLDGESERRAVTLQLLSALNKLTRAPELGDARH